MLRARPGRESTDLRNPAAGARAARPVGVDVPDTRAWRLEPFRGTPPAGRRAARPGARRSGSPPPTATAGWTPTSGADGRLRGAWTGCDGAAGRMTASAGLHNLPAELRPAGRRRAGHVFVRADLGQIEPRVLAAVSGRPRRSPRRPAPTTSTRRSAPQLGVDRPMAKVAVLAAMYGQTTGAAGEALRGLERGLPGGDGLPRRARTTGRRGRRATVRTYGGRLIRCWPRLPDAAPSAVRRRRGARPVRAQRGDPGRGGRAVQGVGGHGARRDARRSARGSCCACTTSCSCTCPRARRRRWPGWSTPRCRRQSRRWTGSDAVRFVADTASSRAGPTPRRDPPRRAGCAP